MARGLMANGNYIRRLRKSGGFSQETLATAVGCDVRTIHNAELGKRVYIETLVNIAGVLDVKLSEIHIASSNDDDLLELRLRHIRRWREAFDSRQLDSLVDVYHDNAEVTYPGLGLLTSGGTATGKAAIRIQLETIFSQFRFDRWSETDARIDASGEFVFLHGRLAGTAVATGQVFTTQAIHEFEFQDRLVIRHTGMFDTSVLRQ